MIHLKENCPLCGDKLDDGEKRRYQTLVEHVTHPNQFPEERDTKVCTNEKCKLSEEGIFWGIEGNMYSTGISHHDLEDLTLTVDTLNIRKED